MQENKSSHWQQAARYAEQVLTGEISACKWVRLACARQLRDLDRERTDPEWPFHFDIHRAEKICSFIEQLRHIKGEWAGSPLILEPWQKFILCSVFGWVIKATGLRRFRTAYSEIPRKNAKSTMSSGVGLYMLTEDGEPGAEVYSAATTRDQAKIVFQAAQHMARRDVDFLDHYGVQVDAHNINVLDTASKFEALSADASSLDGLNVHCGIIDELHAHRTREVWDVIETATGSRQQSLIWAITTAGSNTTGICYEQRTYVTKILEEVFVDETYFGIIFSIDEGDEWALPASWQKANPNFGISVKPEDLQRKAVKAMQMPSAVNNYLSKHLNVWLSSDVGLVDMAAWADCGDPKLTPEDFIDCPCWLALDLGFVSDIASAVKCFIRGEPDPKDTNKTITKTYFFGRHYLPEEAIEDSSNSQYSGWRRMGRIIATDGNVTDIEVILDDVMEDVARFQVQEVLFDPYNKLALLNSLQKRGVSIDQLVEFPQQVATMSPATESFMRDVMARTIGHDCDPVLTWAVSNLVGHFDAKGNVYPKKARPELKIDPAIAAIMGKGRSMLHEPSCDCPLLVISL